MEGIDLSYEEYGNESGYSKWNVVAFIFNLLRKYPLHLVTILILSIFVALSELFSIALFIPLIESLRETNASSLSGATPIGFMSSYFEDLSTVGIVRTVAICLLVVQMVKSVSKYFSAKLSCLFHIRIDTYLRTEVMGKMLLTDLKIFHKEKIARFYTILNNYTGNTSNMARLIVGGVPDVFVAIISIGILFSISIPMTIVGFVLGIFTSLTLGKFAKKAGLIGRLVNHGIVQVNHVGFEILNGMALIRVFAREDYSRKRFKSSVEHFQQASYRMGLVQAIISPISNTMFVITLVALLVSATFILHMETDYWFGLLVVFLLVFSRLSGPFGNLNSLITRFSGAFHSIRSVMSFLDQQNDQAMSDGGIQFRNFENNLRFENLSFKYDSSEKNVLNDVSFSIPKGKVTAIVGASGSGKSTMVALLARLYEPTKGRIVLDGKDFLAYKSNSWRRRIGLVNQKTFLFNDSIINNIRFGRLEATDQDIHEAAQKAYAHEFIMEMQEGYQTQVGDFGVRLSGGQAQRIAIARAILVDPTLMILDEATSALDTASERIVQKAIEEVSRNRTVVTVAHRLSTIQNADNIIVLEEGRVVEQGTHQSLINQQGSYWKYAQLQELSGADSVVDASDNNL